MTNTPIVAGVDYGKGDECVVAVMQDNKVIATFTGKYAVLHATNWARLKNLKVRMIFGKEE